MQISQTSRNEVAAGQVPTREYFVDADEAAVFIRAERRTVLQWARDGRIPAHPLDPAAERKDWRLPAVRARRMAARSRKLSVPSVSCFDEIQ
jgi:hypothetical protein